MKDKEGLKPGLIVKNTFSGQVARIKADVSDPTKLAKSSSKTIRVKIIGGKCKTGHRDWALKNVKLLDSPGS